MEQPGQLGLLWLPVLALLLGPIPAESSGWLCRLSLRGKKEGWGLLELALLRPRLRWLGPAGCRKLISSSEDTLTNAGLAGAMGWDSRVWSQ